MARAITTAADVPGDRARRRRQPMDVRRARRRSRCGRRAASRRSRSRRRSRCSSARSRFRHPTRRAVVAGRALPLPKANPQRIVVLGDTGCRIKAAERVFQACNDTAAVAVRGGRRRGGGAGARSRHPRRRLSLPRERVPGRQRGLRRQPVGLRLGRVGGRSLRAGGEAARRRAVDRRARQPRVVRSRRAGLVAIPRSAPAAARQDCNAPADDARGDYSEPYAVPLGSAAGADTQFIVFDSSLVGVAPLPPSDPMYVRYRAQLERAFALARAAAQHVLHEPPSGARVRAQSRPGPTPRIPGNGALQSVLGALQPTVLFPPEREGAARRPRAPVRGGELHDAAAGAVRLRQRRRLGRHAAALAAAGGNDAHARRGHREPGGDEPLRLHDDGARWRGLADGRARRARRADDLVHAVERRANCEPAAPTPGRCDRRAARAERCLSPTHAAPTPAGAGRHAGLPASVSAAVRSSSQTLPRPMPFASASSRASARQQRRDGFRRHAARGALHRRLPLAPDPRVANRERRRAFPPRSPRAPTPARGRPRRAATAAAGCLRLRPRARR